MRISTAVFIATLIATFFPCAAFAQPAQPTLKLKVLAGRPVVDGVFMNGHGPYRFLLDTGNQTNAVEAGLAKKLGLKATIQSDIQSPSGLLRARGGKVNKVSLGPEEAEDQEFMFTSLDGVHALAPDIQGILGQAFLAHFNYTLDFQHHLLTFGNLPVVSGRIAVKVVAGCMSVPTNQGDLILDSGADTVFLFRQPSQPALTRISTANGQSAAVSMERAPELRIGEQRYHPENMELLAVADAPSAGLLPAALFHAVYISNSEGYVIFNPGSR